MHTKPRLRIETGRFEKLRAEDRKCQFCDSNEVDDENHFFMKCHLLAQERQELFSKLELQNLQNISLQDMLTLENPTYTTWGKAKIV